MSRKDDRSRCLELRHNPSLAFASTNSLTEAVRLVHEADGGQKLRNVLSDVSKWLSPRAALTYWNLYSRAEKMTTERAKRLIRVRSDPKTVLIDIERDWCTTPERAITYFGTLLDGLCQVPLTKQGVGLAGYAASWMLLNHNPSHFADYVPIPTTDIADTLPLKKLELLYEAVAGGNQEALDILYIWWRIMGHYGKVPSPHGTSKRPGVQMVWSPPDCFQEAVTKLGERMGQISRESGLDEVMSIVKEKKGQIAGAINSLWQDIQKNARRGIRPEGDMFHVQKPFDVADSGHRCLFSTDLAFPKICVGSAIRCRGKHLWMSERVSPDQPIPEEPQHLLSILVSLLAYQLLVCQEPAEHENNLPRPADSVEQIIGLPYSVRHHDRRLPEGQRSHKQAEYKAAFGRTPDDGITFVKAHERQRRPSFRRLRKLDQSLPMPLVTVNVGKVLNDL